MGSKTFNYTGAWDTWTVPDGVSRVDVVMTGGGAPGGAQGGRVTGWFSVNDGLVLKFLVGQKGDPASGNNGGGIATGGGGAGGNGTRNPGGDGGGGGSFIRKGSNSGTLVAVAGGGGGASGDNGQGGDGGGLTGNSGQRGTSGSNSTGAATGGSQSAPGKGGTSSSGSQFNGNAGSFSSGGDNGQGGHGGGTGGADCHGGGGGGGGYRSGGGGQASSAGFAPGGGGGGGSSFVDALNGSTNTRNGGTGNGSITITWTNPAPANQPPNNVAKANVTIAGKDASGGTVATKVTSNAIVRAKVQDPDNDRVKLVVVWTSVPWVDPPSGEATPTWGNAKTWKGDLVDSGGFSQVNLTGLSQDRHYFLRLYAEEAGGKRSTQYTSVDFYTNRSPRTPTLTSPSDGSSFSSAINKTFTWTFRDPDPGDTQTAFRIRYRSSATSTDDAGDWQNEDHTYDSAQGAVPQHEFAGGTFKGNRFYDWTVQTRDPQDKWGDWADFISFYVTGVSTPPQLLHPIKGEAVNVDQPVAFDWNFKDPVQTDSQKKADIRWRIAGQTDSQWITTFGQLDPFQPGTTTHPQWTFPPGSFIPAYRYEYQVRTYDSTVGDPSDWTDSEFFQTISTPGGGVPPDPVADPNFVQGALGCGTYRAFIYQQGGKRLLGEISPISKLQFDRVRDDISTCTFTTNGFGEDCGKTLALLRSWMHEVVIFRDGERVWEGPITLVAYAADSVQIEAKDVMAYLYRRIMRQGFDDRYKYNSATKKTTGGLSVVTRAYRITVNALAPMDPNVLPYLTIFEFKDDAQEGRRVPDFSVTAWECIDDLAATAGLDYTVVGRRIIYNDTHRPVGRLPELRDGDFSDPPIVTEYGMQLCNFSAVTNNSGLWAAARPKAEVNDFDFYGPIEMLASSYNEKNTKDKLAEQAQRNIAHRWPSPLIVRIPDNSTLNPDVQLGFGQLVPGVWLPLRSSTTLRDVSQWQKLDSVTVTFEKGVEQVQVVMSPAPNGGEDPDADQAAEDAG